MNDAAHKRRAVARPEAPTEWRTIILEDARVGGRLFERNAWIYVDTATLRILLRRGAARLFNPDDTRLVLGGLIEPASWRDGSG